MVLSSVTTELEVKDASLLNAATDASHVDTASLRECVISTTISDIRYGAYKSNNQAHEVCIIFFAFEIVGQRSRSNQRIKELGIKLSLFPSSSATPGVSSATASNSALEIRYREPSHGRTKPSQVQVKREARVGAQAGYQFAGLNGSYSVLRERDVADWGFLESYIEKKRHIHLNLCENQSLEEGIPNRLEVALVVRTGGLPFKIGAYFKAKIPYLGKLWTKEATTGAVVEESILDKNKDKHDDDSVTGLDDISSDLFMEWVKSKVKNEWIVEL